MVERRRLRDDLRRQGIPIPVELLEESAWTPSTRPAAATTARSGTLRPAGAVRGDGQAHKTLVRTWLCGCGYWNWPSRSACRECGAARRPGAERKNDWWDIVALPAGADVDVGADYGPPRKAQAGGGGVPLGSRPAAVDGPGCPTSRRGQGPSASSGLRFRTAVSGGASDERRDAPGVLDGRGGDGAGIATTWAGRVAGQRAQERPESNRRGIGEGGGTRRTEDPNNIVGTETVEFPGAPKPSELPALRNWSIPTVPRAALLRDFKVASAQLEQLEAAGAKASRIKKAEQRKAAAEQQVRVGGGPTSRSLLWQIQNEERHIEKAGTAIEKELKENENRKAAIKKLEAEVQTGMELIKRLEDRREEAVARLRYLSNQKWVQWVPEQWVQHFKDLAQTLGEANHGAHSMVQTLVDLMVLPTESVDLTMEDSESGSEDDVSLGSNLTVPEDADRVPGSGVGAAGRAGGGANADQVTELEAKLEALRAQRLAAMAQSQVAASARNRGQVKRSLGGDEGKAQDVDGDTEMVPLLSPGQAEGLLRHRINDTMQSLRELRRDDAPEVVPCGAPLGSTPTPASAPQQAAARPTGADTSGEPHGAAATELDARPPLPRSAVRGRTSRQSSPQRPAGTMGKNGEGPHQRWETDEQRHEKTAFGTHAATRPASLGPPKRAAASNGTDRAPSDPPPPTLRQLEDEVARETRAQQEMADRLVTRVEVEKQRRMQERHEKEARAHTAVLQAKAEIEARIGGLGQVEQAADPALEDVRMDEAEARPRNRWTQGGFAGPPSAHRGRPGRVLAEEDSGSGGRGNSRSLRPRARGRDNA